MARLRPEEYSQSWIYRHILNMFFIGRRTTVTSRMVAEQCNISIDQASGCLVKLTNMGLLDTASLTKTTTVKGKYYRPILIFTLKV